MLGRKDRIDLKRRIILAAIIAVHAAAIIALTQYRSVDGDEGFYAAAARLVGEGKSPYHDFFYPQAPVLPFVYGAWSGLFGYSLTALRLLSAFFTICTVALWAWVLHREFPSPLWLAPTALLLLACHPFVASWGVTVKTYALGNLLATLMLVGLWRAGATGRNGWTVAAGMAAGALVSTRLLYAAVPLAAVASLLLHGRTGGGTALRRVGIFSLGFALACAPAGSLAFRDPQVALFNTIGYHLLQGETETFVENASGSAMSLTRTIISHPFLALQFVLAFIGGVTMLQRKAPLRPTLLLVLSLSTSAALLLVSLAPAHFYEQYFTSPPAPLLVPAVAAGLMRLWRALRALLPLCGVASLALALPEADAELREAALLPAWQVKTVRTVAALVKDRTNEQDTVISLWPGYVVESGRRFLPGLENHFGLLAAKRVPPPDRSRYHIVTAESVAAAIEHGTARVVILGSWVRTFYEGLGEAERVRLAETLTTRYSLVHGMEDADIYERQRGGRGVE